MTGRPEVSGTPAGPVRPVVTGVGMVTPAGIGAEAFWSQLVGSASDAVPSTAAPGGAGLVRPGVPAPAVAHTVGPALEDADVVDPRALRKVSDFTRLVTVAAALCVEDAALGEDGRDDTGICLGTSFGSSSYHLEYHEALRRGGVKGASALLFTHSVFNAATGHVGQVLGLRGSNLTLVGGEAVGLEAVLRAAARLRLGAEPAALAGGAEQYSDLVHASVHQSGLVGADAAGSAASPGTVSEGAALVLLESAEAAAARGAVPYAELLGGGCARGAADAGGVGGCVGRAAAKACSDAGLEPGALDLVIACPPAGRDTSADLEAAAALGAAFTTVPTLPWGEGFAFTSSLGVALAAVALQRGVVPPTAWPECAAAREHTIGYALVVASTSRDRAAAVVLGRVAGEHGHAP